MWWTGWGGLRWVDLLEGDLLTLGEGGEVLRRHVSRVAAAIRPRTGGGTIVATGRGVELLDPDDEVEEVIGPLWERLDVRMNEGGCGPDGSFYCGSMQDDGEPAAGSLLRIRPDRSVERVLTSVTVSNGIDFSGDGRHAYYVDSATGRIDVFEVTADGSFDRRRPFAAIEGTPDGLTVDAEGGVWVAVWGGGRVEHRRPSGELAETVELPTPLVTACTFGGPDLTTLYVTTSALGVPGGSRDAAGRVYALENAGLGRPAAPFQG